MHRRSSTMRTFFTRWLGSSSVCVTVALGWLGTTLPMYLSTSLRVPISFEQVVVEGNVATVVENDHPVFS